AGRHGDRHGAGRIIVPDVLTSAAGMLVLVLVPRPVALLVGRVLRGAGFGAIQNASMAVMLDRVAPSGYGAVSALWSVGYDGGEGPRCRRHGSVGARDSVP